MPKREAKISDLASSRIWLKCIGSVYSTLYILLTRVLALQARLFFPGKPFQPSMMFVGKSMSLPYAEVPYLHSLISSVGPSWKGLPGKHSSLLCPFVSREEN